MTPTDAGPRPRAGCRQGRPAYPQSSARLGRDDGAHALRLAEPEFEQQPSAGTERGGRLRDQAPDDVEAIVTARQRLRRFVIAHLGLQARDVGDRHVGRVRHDGIEWPLHAGEQVCSDEPHTRR